MNGHQIVDFVTCSDKPGPEVIQLFVLNSYEHKISTAHENINAEKLSDVVFILLINVKMPTIVGILTFMSRINFVLS